VAAPNSEQRRKDAGYAWRSTDTCLQTLDLSAHSFVMATEVITEPDQTSDPQRKPWEDWFESIAAVTLGLAMLGSAWSGYQSSLWGSIQSFRIAEALATGRKAAERTVYANQLRGIDIILFERYVSALSQNNKQLADFLLQRFRPEFRPAFEAWLASGGPENPAAPATPFVMREYSLAPEKEAQQLRQQEDRKFAEARKANQLSDTYLLYTVLYSMVLFLSGITAAFERRKLRTGVLALSLITMATTSIALAFLPLAAE
jgi:hypothetical protein